MKWMAMEVKQLNKKLNFENDEVIISHGGISFSFYKYDRSLVFASMLPESWRHLYLPAPEGINYCRETEVQVTGRGRDFAARSRSLGGIGESLEYLGISYEDEDCARTYSIEYIERELNLRIVSKYKFIASDLPVVRRWVEVNNELAEPVGLERACSVAMYHLTMPGRKSWSEKMFLHVPYSSWSGEAQWQKLSMAQAGIASKDASHYRAVCLGSRSSAEYSPMGVLEDSEANICWFWQIEHSGSWMWETGRLFVGAQHGLYLIAGGPDEEFGHWWKNLKPGQKFVSVPVSVGCVKGGFQEAVQVLTEYRRKACRKAHPADDNLPVIFNDYMNCLWGNPSVQKELPLISAAAEVGCEYYCIDSGWYAGPEENWWPNVGHWMPDEDRFGKNGFIELIDKIRDTGMIPGLWIEAEVVGVNNSLAAKDDSWFLQRHGKRIIYNGRYFLNFMNTEVIEWLDSVIDRFVFEYNIGYIKNDYNIDLHIGAENNADSFGDGLLQHIRAFYLWIDRIHERHPNLIWENCAAGGLRNDYGILSHAQLQSSSDLDEYHMYSALVTGCSATTLPEQMAVWSYPTDPEDIEQTIYNMVNSILSRIHLSGRLSELSKQCRQLVLEAIQCYKDTRMYIPRSVPFYPLALPAISKDNCWQGYGLKGPGVHHLALWRKDPEKESCIVDLSALGEIKTIECIYPEKKQFAPSLEILDNTKIKVVFPVNITARLFRIISK